MPSAAQDDEFQKELEEEIKQHETPSTESLIDPAAEKAESNSAMGDAIPLDKKAKSSKDHAPLEKETKSTKDDVPSEKEIISATDDVPVEKETKSKADDVLVEKETKSATDDVASENEESETNKKDTKSAAKTQG